MTSCVRPRDLLVAWIVIRPAFTAVGRRDHLHTGHITAVRGVFERDIYGAIGQGARWRSQHQQHGGQLSSTACRQ